jgi:hypothetical protein
MGYTMYIACIHLHPLSALITLDKYNLDIIIHFLSYFAISDLLKICLDGSSMQI